MNVRLLLATGNPGKIVEFRDLFAPLPWTTLTLTDLGIVDDVDETGSTFRENALLKAEVYAHLSGLPALSDDSGLEVAALGGEPGLRSRRYSPLPDATDADRRRYLLSRLDGLPRPWTARFCCVVAVVFPGGEVEYGEGICPGEIIPEERGSGGFGYDPIFLLPNGRTMAELEDAEKNRLSHRALAVIDVLPRLIQKFSGM